MIHHNMPWADYHSREQMNGSTLAHIFESPRQLKYVLDNGFIPKTDVHVGSALHLIVEYLPLDKFEAFYCVEPDFSNSPDNQDAKGNPSKSSNTNWCKQQREAFAANETREVLTHKEYRRIVRMLQSIESNKHALDIVLNTHPMNRELSVTGTINDVPLRGRVDGFCDGLQWNLKSTRSNEPKRFGYTCRDMHYLFKDCIHMALLEQHGYGVNEFSYIVVKDAVPRQDGGYNECPDCSVVPVPMVAFENVRDLVYEKLALYKQCLERDEWPGVGDYELYIPDSYMALVD